MFAGHSERSYRALAGFPRVLRQGAKWQESSLLAVCTVKCYAAAGEKFWRSVPHVCRRGPFLFFFWGGQVEISLQKLHLFPVKSDILSSGSWGGDHLSLLFPISSKWTCQNIKLDYLQNHIFSYHIFQLTPDSHQSLPKNLGASCHLKLAFWRICLWRRA